MKTAILYGSATGKTEDIAHKLKDKIGGDTVVYDVDDLTIDKFEEYPNLILATSTTGFGELQTDWDKFLNDFLKADLNGKTVAIVGLGDSEMYGDSFVGSMRELYDAILDKGCKITGAVSTADYDFESSPSEIDGKFVGLALDEETSPQKTKNRLDKWLKQILPDFVQ